MCYEKRRIIKGLLVSLLNRNWRKKPILNLLPIAVFLRIDIERIQILHEVKKGREV